ncbi:MULTISPECIES: hypothetical protein [Pseudomonas aeruginosa group]|uniref:hypothetical protein n=1 Tax=Pseudomonas aeruginosa group TaxID=136841 RepID=UPI001F466D6C|nr:hypothetical protein [Pseudomonas pseudonitroreducens]
MSMVEDVIQTQELLVMTLLASGHLDRARFEARLKDALANSKRVGTDFPLNRLLQIVKGNEPPPPRWTPRLIRGKPDA